MSDLHILSDIRNRLTVAENAGDPEPICAAMSDDVVLFKITGARDGHGGGWSADSRHDGAEYL